MAATCKCSLSLTVGEHGAVRLDSIVVRDLHVARVVALVLNSKSFDAQPAHKQETHGWCELLIVVMTSRQVTCTDRHDCSVGFSMLHLLLSFVSMSVEMRRVVSRPFLSYAVRCQITCKQTRRQTIESHRHPYMTSLSIKTRCGH